MISDSPVTLHNANDFGPYGNLGLTVRGIEIYFPISSTLSLAFFCRTIPQGMEDTIASLTEQLSRFAAMRLLGANVDLARLDEAMEKATNTRDRLNSDLAALKAGAAILCSPDNVTHMNSLQISNAERFVMSGTSDFALAKRMIKKHPHLKRGPRYAVD